MKQHITLEQFESVSQEIQDELFKYGQSKSWDDNLPCFTIGQLLEWLHDWSNRENRKKAVLGLYENPEGWAAKIYIVLPGNEMGPGHYFVHKPYLEVIDCLWDTIVTMIKMEKVIEDEKMAKERKN